MAKQNSFDIVSITDMTEVQNAIYQTMKEIRQRFDFKGSKSNITHEDTELVLISDDEYRLRAVTDILEQRLIKRGVSLKALQFGRIEDAAGGTVRQRVQIQQGIDSEKARQISKHIRNMKLKVQASIQGDSLRVSGKALDTLQSVIQALKEEDFGIDLQFTNYRSH